MWWKCHKNMSSSGRAAKALPYPLGVSQQVASWIILKRSQQVEMEPSRGDTTLNVTVIQCVGLEKETKRQGKGHARRRSEEGDSWHGRRAGVRDQEWQEKRRSRELMMSSFLVVQPSWNKGSKINPSPLPRLPSDWDVLSRFSHSAENVTQASLKP